MSRYNRCSDALMDSGLLRNDENQTNTLTRMRMLIGIIPDQPGSGLEGSKSTEAWLQHVCLLPWGTDNALELEHKGQAC